MGHFCVFLFISLDKNSTNLNINNKSVDGVLGTQTWGSRMVGADKSTELWRLPNSSIFCLTKDKGYLDQPSNN